MRSIACIAAGTLLVVVPGYDRLGALLLGLGLLAAVVGWAADK